MHDIKKIKLNKKSFIERLNVRGNDFSEQVEQLLQIASHQQKIRQKLEHCQYQINLNNQKLFSLISAKDNHQKEIPDLQIINKNLKQESKSFAEELKEVSSKLETFLLEIPNTISVQVQKEQQEMRS
jgi:seryl-tRNA synthetase